MRENGGLCEKACVSFRLPAGKGMFVLQVLSSLTLELVPGGEAVWPLWLGLPLPVCRLRPQEITSPTFLLFLSFLGHSFSASHSSLFFLFIFNFFWLHHAACGILVPWPGIEPMPLAVEAWSLTHWTTREVPSLLFSQPVNVGIFRYSILGFLLYVLSVCVAWNIQVFDTCFLNCAFCCSTMSLFSLSQVLSSSAPPFLIIMLPFLFFYGIGLALSLSLFFL